MLIKSYNKPFGIGVADDMSWTCGHELNDYSFCELEPNHEPYPHRYRFKCTYIQQGLGKYAHDACIEYHLLNNANYWNTIVAKYIKKLIEEGYTSMTDSPYWNDYIRLLPDEFKNRKI